MGDAAPLISNGFTKYEAHTILEAVLQQLLANDSLTEAIITEGVKTLIQNMVDVLDKSKDLAYQQQTISPRIKKCLPLATDKLSWDPVFFTDIRGLDFYTEIADAINGSAISDQNCRLIHLVQSKLTCHLT